MSAYSADYLFMDGDWVAGHWIDISDDGTILGIHDTPPPADHSYHAGCILPGLINAHCHLELSHMQGLLPTGTGLVDFILGVLQQRAVDDHVIQDAAVRADKYMYSAGVQAVGDICNTLHTQAAKLQSQMSYVNFVEAYDLFQGTEDNPYFSSHLETYHQLQLKSQDQKSLVPHAPYSVSPGAFAQMSPYFQKDRGTISIHNQETPSENAFFTENTGALVDFYAAAGMSLHIEDIAASSSLRYALHHLPTDRRILLVHNTMTTTDDVLDALSTHSDLYWCTCPRANLYIENRLPDYTALRAAGARICVGTDSLSSNWSLSVWDELKTIAQYQSSIPITELLSWATLHGAEALSLDDQLGRIKIGLSPGIVHVDINPEKKGQSIARSSIQRLV